MFLILSFVVITDRNCFGKNESDNEISYSSSSFSFNSCNKHVTRQRIPGEYSPLHLHTNRTPSRMCQGKQCWRQAGSPSLTTVLLSGCRRQEPDLCADGDPGEEFPGVDVGAGGLSVYP